MLRVTPYSPEHIAAMLGITVDEARILFVNARYMHYTEEDNKPVIELTDEFNVHTFTFRPDENSVVAKSEQYFPESALCIFGPEILGVYYPTVMDDKGSAPTYTKITSVVDGMAMGIDSGVSVWVKVTLDEVLLEVLLETCRSFLIHFTHSYVSPGHPDHWGPSSFMNQPHVSPSIDYRLHSYEKLAVLKKALTKK